MNSVTLSLDKITKGFYSKSVDGVTIELINPKSYTHGLSEDNQWKLTIETKNELAIEAWFDTKKEAIKSGTIWVMQNI